MKKYLTVFVCVLALFLTACSAPAPAAVQSALPSGEPSLFQQEAVPSLGGVLRLTVNPEIAVFYNENGTVTKVEGRNEDGSRILADYSGFQGKTCKTVVAELVDAIGNAGYFVDDIDGSRRQITLEIEPGSHLPSDVFLAEVAEEVRRTVDNSSWNAPVATPDASICTNPNCKDNDCDDHYCDAGVCTNPYCDDWDCDDAYCDDNIPGPDRDVRTCTNPNCKDDDCDDRYCDAGVCTNPYCDDWDCDDAYCDEGYNDDHDDHHNRHGRHD